MKIPRRRTPPASTAADRADAAATHAQMARFAVEDGSDGNEVEHRCRKAVRAAKGQPVLPRDDPNSTRD
ncbi:hypothetical protein [Streptomyces sp. XY431]|uniref:hypothetical protein n=1 Tax=Streptomyces sp. XY431 TaxID=1415562 RepID=UPI0006B006F9|nr:hypothetical protein [Streptomyces sp. XY431]